MEVQTAYSVSVRHRFVFCNDFERGGFFWGMGCDGGRRELSEQRFRDFQDGRAGQGGDWLGARHDSVGQERGWVVRGDGLSAEGDEVVVVGGGEGVDGLGGGEGLPAEGIGFAALCGVEEEDAVGEGGDAGVAAG